MRGAADTIVAGATGTRVHPLRTLHVVLQEEIARDGDDPSRACRPFDRHRSGMVLGEGAGAVVLESLETAQARGAKILGEIIGSGSSAAMDARGVGDLRAAIRSALRQTLRSAGLTPAAVGHVHAHGVSTRRSDAAEAQAIQEVFAERPAPVPVTAAKSYLGNSGAACGVMELIASVLALEARSAVSRPQFRDSGRTVPGQCGDVSRYPAGRRVRVRQRDTHRTGQFAGGPSIRLTPQLDTSRDTCILAGLKSH